MATKTTFDIESPIGQVRLLIPDDKPEKVLFSDDKIKGFLLLEDSVVKRAAALALETIATNMAMTLSYIETNRIKLDGSKPAKVCLDRAQLLRGQVAPAQEDPDEDEWAFIFGCEG